MTSITAIIFLVHLYICCSCPCETNEWYSGTRLQQCSWFLKKLS